MHEEHNYKNLVGSAHLRRFGQYFTPEELAQLMARWVDQISPATVLDPAAGNHIFARALKNIGSSARVMEFEIDPIIASEFPPPDNATTNLKDYLLSSWSERYDGIIANPPYMKFQLIENREAIREHFVSNYDAVPNWQSNIYVLFLLKALRQLKSGGRMIFLVPHDFLDSKSGSLLKSELVQSRCLEGIVSLEQFEGDLFPDALTSASLLKISGKNNRAVRFSRPCSALELEEAVLGEKGGRAIALESLQAQLKWGVYFSDRDPVDSETCLGDYVEIKRGIATGANEFFVLKPSTAASLDIEECELSDIVSKSSLIKGAVFTGSQMSNLIDSDAKCKLFTPKEHLSEAAQAYVKAGERAGWNAKYLCAARKEWFRSEVRESAPIWVSQASRGKVRVIRNRTNALNLTTFHGVWPVELLGLTPDAMFALLVSSLGQEALIDTAKRMASGLLKIQPGDLKGMRVPNLHSDMAMIEELDRLGASLGADQNEHRLVVSEIDEVLSQLI